jgi:hypothetical protein
MRRSLASVSRLGAAALAAAFGLLWLTAPAAAAGAAGIVEVVSGGCIARGVSTSGGEIDLTTATIWHVRRDDTIRMSGTAPTPQTKAAVAAGAFGFEIPLASATADGETAAETDEFEIEALATLGRAFLVYGHASGPDDRCDGQVLVVIDDVNPLTTGLGVGGIVTGLVGGVLLGWAVRDPVRTVRRYTGLIGLVLLGLGASVVLQQVLPPSAADLGPGGAIGEFARSPFDEGKSPFVDSVLSPTQLSLDPLFAAQSLILTLLILLLLPFPSQLFNSTLSENESDIRAALGRVPGVRRFVRPTSEDLPGAAPKAWWRQPAIVGFLLISGLLYSLLDPTFGLDQRSAVLFTGIVVSLLLVTWLADVPRRALHRRIANDPGRLWVVPATLLVGAVCVLISRLVGYLPGYLYGLVIGYAFLATIEPRQEGRAGTLGAWWMLALAFASWLTLGAVRVPGIQETIPGAIVEACLAAVMVAGVEGVVFALMPLRFLPGELAFRWQRLPWAVIYGIGLFAFVFIFLNPANGYLPQQDAVSFGVALALFVGFGIASILFWGFFKLRSGRQKPATS